MPRRDQYPRTAAFSAARQWHTLLVYRATKIRIDEPRGHLGDRLQQCLIRDLGLAAPASEGQRLEHLAHIAPYHLVLWYASISGAVCDPAQRLESRQRLEL